MKENMSNGLGWVDRGPATVAKHRAPIPTTRVSQVMVTAGPRKGAVFAAYSEAEVQDIVKQGKVAPRRLNLEQSRLADFNRAMAAGHYQAIDRVYRELSHTVDCEERTGGLWATTCQCQMDVARDPYNENLPRYTDRPGLHSRRSYQVRDS